MNISDAIAKYLKINGVNHVFGIHSGTILSLWDSFDLEGIDLLVIKNEGGAAYSASRYASVSNKNKLAVCLGAGAVGICNMFNGIGDAFRDKSPVLIISGFIDRKKMNKNAIQDMNAEKMAENITKYSKTIFDENKVIAELEKAIKIALTPPYGPVHIAVPLDIQKLEFKQEIPKEVEIAPHENDYNELLKAVELIEKEEKGLIMVGKGSRGLKSEIEKLADKLGWYTITTPGGKGNVSGNFKYNLGNYGFAGTDSANQYVNNGDYSCLLVLGSSLGEASTRVFDERLVKNKKIIHIDWDESQFNKVFSTDITVKAELGQAIRYILENVKEKQNKPESIKEWNKPYVRNHTGLSMRQVMENVSDVMPQNTLYVCDIGGCLNFSLKYLSLPKESEYEVNLNYGAMGSAIGGAVGAHLANPQMQTAVFAGDGAFFMNGLEILTAKEYKLPIVYFILNNAKLEYVEKGYKLLCNNREGTGFRFERLGFENLAKSLNIKGMTVEKVEDLKRIPQFINNLKGPCIIDLITDGSEELDFYDRIESLSLRK